MSIAATCATLATLLLQAHGGEVYSLKGDCTDLRITAKPAKRVTINAGGTTIRSLRITGGNIRGRGGTVRAISGPFAVGPSGYGVWLNAATNVRLDGVLVTGARKGIVVAGGSSITIADSRLLAVGEDGIIYSSVRGLTVVRNRFSGTIGRASECEVAGVVSLNVPKRDCRGAFRDGTHGDAVQGRAGATDVLIADNDISGGTQGITQMDTIGDAPLVRVTVRGNRLRTDRQHPVTFGECVDCRIENNDVGRPAGITARAVIIAGKARSCGNTVMSVKEAPCP